MEKLIPVEGCWVQTRSEAKTQKYRVVGEVLPRGEQVLLRLENGAGKTSLALSELCNGLNVGWRVKCTNLQTKFGFAQEGTIVAKRRLAGFEQALVELDTSRHRIWLSYEMLERIRSADECFASSLEHKDQAAERLRLRLLAHALENWNELTGSLDRLDVDPLPHQIQLVRKIITSGSLEWLIADDVGLGKTIEVGLLLHALKQKGQASRVLIVTPAGLVRQWQDEMFAKFSEDYEIYGADGDFQVGETRRKRWQQNKVIVSIDRAKQEAHFDIFSNADDWDVVVFDEGHKLTRYETGERSDRYKLAEMLRKRTRAFFVLSGTPHQGYEDRFKNLLKLVRPDLKKQIDTLKLRPEIVSDMIVRNKKIDVTDANGQFVFKGQEVKRVQVELSQETQHFRSKLQAYLKNGYKMAEKGDSKSRAIGFVMTTYRKLASSSIAAIEAALKRRLEKLLIGPVGRSVVRPELDNASLIEGGDEQDDLIEQLELIGLTGSFFDNEESELKSLIELAGKVKAADKKLQVFMDQVAETLVARGEKLLVFTEYRATQDYLVEAIKRRFRQLPPPVLINGSMKLQDKMEAIDRFNDDVSFLISTEAGGEGLNMHQACYHMVNYDLPWNPARLVQRTGRLYRYGQQQKVRVFNLLGDDTFENAALSKILGRVDTIAEEMNPVSDEFDERLKSEVVGDLLENIEVGDLLKQEASSRTARTDDEIEEAVRKAKAALQDSEEFLGYASVSEDVEVGSIRELGPSDLFNFVVGILDFIGCTDIRPDADTLSVEFHLPKTKVGEFSEFGKKSIVKVTTNRTLANQNRLLHLLDFKSEFVLYLVNFAKACDFGAFFANTQFPDAQDRSTLSFVELTWQNAKGRKTHSEMITQLINADGSTSTEVKGLSLWLRINAKSPVAVDEKADPTLVGRHKTLAEGFQMQKCGMNKMPASMRMLGAARLYSK